MLTSVSTIASFMRQDRMLCPVVPREDLGRRADDLEAMIEVLRQYVQVVDVPEDLTWIEAYAALREKLDDPETFFKPEHHDVIRYGLAILKNEANNHPDRPLRQAPKGKAFLSSTKILR